MKPGLISSLITFCITLGTSLIALLTQEGVKEFSDIPQTGYAVAIIGALVAAAMTYKARIMEAPKPEYIRPKNKQSGNILRNQIILNIVVFLGLLCFALSGCSILKPVVESEPWKPFYECVNVTTPVNETLFACNVSVRLLAGLSDDAQEAGFITVDDKMEILNHLYDAVMMLRKIRTSENLIGLEQVQMILLEIKGQLPDKVN